MARTRRILRLNDVLSEFCMPLRPRAAHPRTYGRLYVIYTYYIRSLVSLFHIARDHVKKCPREFACSFPLFFSRILFAFSRRFFFPRQCILATKKTPLPVFGLLSFHRFRRFDGAHRIIRVASQNFVKIECPFFKTFLNSLEEKKK